MKKFVIKLSKELFKLKLEIEKELINGNKTNEELYSLILKVQNFLENGRSGEPISKKLPIYKYFENNSISEPYLKSHISK